MEKLRREIPVQSSGRLRHALKAGLSGGVQFAPGKRGLATQIVPIPPRRDWNVRASADGREVALDAPGGIRPACAIIVQNIGSRASFSG
jgi:hypothetical protein